MSTRNTAASRCWPSDSSKTGVSESVLIRVRSFCRRSLMTRIIVTWPWSSQLPHSDKAHRECYTTAMGILVLFVRLYGMLVFISAILSWFPQARNHPIAQLVDALVEPLLAPIRKVLPPAGGMDFSAIIAFIGLQVLARMLI